MSIRIILAEDHRVVREGLRTLIEKQPNMQVVAEAEDGRTTVRLVKQLLPDVVIMDVAMPSLNGIEATRQIIAETSSVKVVALSMHSDKRFIKEMFRSGASGYLLKDCAFEELVHAIRVVAAHQNYLSPKITDVVIKDYLRKAPSRGASAFSVLTPREREVLQLIAEGKTTKQIAFSLRLSTKTVETYRRHLMNKLNIHSIAELTKYAIREGITFVEP